MAYSVSHKPKTLFSWQLVFFFFFLLTTTPCTATRPGRLMMMINDVLPEVIPENMKHYHPKYQGFISSQLPKGDNHPRPGSSKRHN